MLKFWLNRAYVSASCLLAVAMGSYAAIIPSAPVLDSVTGFPPTFSWNTAAGASSYTLQVSTDYYFSATTFSQSGITGTSLTLPSSLYDSLLESVPWYWRVNAANTNGESGWSSVGSRGGALTCNYVVDLYDQYGGGPANAATNVQLPVTISWGNGLYECTLSPPPFSLQVATDTGFSSLVIDTGNVGVYEVLHLGDLENDWVYSVLTSNLENSTTYYWRIRSGGGPWLDTSKFTTALAGPALSSPLNTAQNLPTTLTLSWGTVSEATSYSLQLSTTYSFSTTVVNQTALTSGSSIISDLANNTIFYWQVTAINADGAIGRSSIWTFTTGGTSVLPVDGKLSKTDFTASNKMISYSLATPSPVEITFSDVLGRTAFVVNRKQSAGRYSIELKNCNLASGHYIVSFKAAGVEKQASVVITR
ncbi:MAG: hypothetical protein ABSE00_09265 [Chitinispirillaceae bacterium]